MSTNEIKSATTDCSASEMQVVPDFLGGHYVGHGKVWVPVGTPFGVAIGRNDREGNPIHIGDVLEFDESEFGEKCVFTIELEGGEIVHNGSASDLSNWCVIVTPWSENKALANPKPRR